MKRCRSTKAHFPTHRAATWRLHRMLDNPTPTADGGVRLYMPSRAIRCTCGGYVLTSKACKPYAKGKQTRRNHR